MKKSNVFNTKVLIRAGLLVAISIVLTRFLSIMVTPQIRLGFGDVPKMLSGFLFGPIVGACVGAISDIVGVSLVPQGTIHLGFTLSSALCGFIPGLFKKYFLKKDESNLTFVIVISCLVVTVFTQIGLNTLWLTQLFGKSFLILLPARSIKCLIEMIVNIFIIRVLYNSLKKI